MYFFQEHTIQSLLDWDLQISERLVFPQQTLRLLCSDVCSSRLLLSEMHFFVVRYRYYSTCFQLIWITLSGWVGGCSTVYSRALLPALYYTGTYFKLIHLCRSSLTSKTYARKTLSVVGTWGRWGWLKYTSPFGADNSARNWALLRKEGWKARTAGLDDSAVTNWDTAAVSVRSREPLRREEEVTSKSRAAWAK